MYLRFTDDVPRIQIETKRIKRRYFLAIYNFNFKLVKLLNLWKGRIFIKIVSCFAFLPSYSLISALLLTQLTDRPNDKWLLSRGYINIITDWIALSKTVTVKLYVYLFVNRSIFEASLWAADDYIVSSVLCKALQWFRKSMKLLFQIPFLDESELLSVVRKSTIAACLMESPWSPHGEPSCLLEKWYVPFSEEWWCLVEMSWPRSAKSWLMNVSICGNRRSIFLWFFIQENKFASQEMISRLLPLPHKKYTPSVSWTRQ